jgi:hypothetical protein
MKHSLCTILYDYDYNLSVKIREVDGGEDDDYSIITVSPAKLRTVQDLQLKIKEDASAVSTEKSSCTRKRVKANFKVTLGAKNDAGDQNGAFNPGPLTKKVDLIDVKDCEKWVDDSGTGGYLVNLDVIRPEDSEFD